jgi:hypothetical protein
MERRQPMWDGFSLGKFNLIHKSDRFSTLLGRLYKQREGTGKGKKGRIEKEWRRRREEHLHRHF